MCAYIHTHNRAYTTRGHWKPCRIFHPSPRAAPSECSQLHKQPRTFSRGAYISPPTDAGRKSALSYPPTRPTENKISPKWKLSHPRRASEQGRTICGERCGRRSRAAPKSKVIFIKLKKTAGQILKEIPTS